MYDVKGKAVGLGIKSTWHEILVQALAERLIIIKQIFPRADAAQLLLQNPSYMLKQDVSIISEACARLRQLIPNVDVDR